MDNQSNNQYQVPIPVEDHTNDVMTVWQYVGMFILSAIPIVNAVCWIVWLCNKSTNKNKKNYIIASIILWLIGAVASVILAVSGVTAALMASTQCVISSIM